MRFSKKLLALTGAIAIGFCLTGCGNQSATGNQTQIIRQVSDHPATANQLQNLNYQSGKSAIVTVNHNHSTLKPSEWKRDHVDYQKPDRENRTSKANLATLDRQNLANDSLRTRQNVLPSGWMQNRINGQPVDNRGHEIAYSLSKGIAKSGTYNPKAISGDQNNPRNLFTQTAFSNQELQTIYESKVRQALRNNEHVIFSVQPIFRGSEQMARGVHLMALSTNHKLNFNVYIYNVQPGAKFNYESGQSLADPKMKVPTPANAPHFNDQPNFQRQHFGFNRGYRYHRHHYIRDAAAMYAFHRIHHHLRYRRYRRAYYRERPLFKHSYRQTRHVF